MIDHIDHALTATALASAARRPLPNLTRPDLSERRPRRKRGAPNRTEPYLGATFAALYLRVSTEEQAREGVSLDAQEARLRAYATAHGLQASAVFLDSGVSGSIPLADRPAGAELLAALAEGSVRHVLAFKLDRLFRDAVDCLRTVRGWDDEGVSMHLVDLGGQAVNTGSAVGRFFLGMLAGVAELERNLIAERTSVALRHKVARGERVGAPPYGYAAVGDGTDWVVVQHEQEAIHRMRSLRTSGLSYSRIASRLASERIPTKKGGAWHAASVRRCLTAPVRTN